MATIPQLKILTSEDNTFPSPTLALTEPNGLLALGGNLSIEQLLTAYKQGIFPWYSKDEPIMWWSPDPRAVIFPTQFKPSRSLTKLIRKNIFTVTMNQAFSQVIAGCAAPRLRQVGTWITQEMQHAYCALFKAGYAQSVEVWKGNTLVGGIYGIDIKPIFCGESMFSHISNASKVAISYLIGYLKQHNYSVLDCQVQNPHLARLGAVEISRTEYLQILAQQVL